MLDLVTERNLSRIQRTFGQDKRIGKVEEKIRQLCQKDRIEIDELVVEYGEKVAEISYKEGLRDGIRILRDLMVD